MSESVENVKRVVVDRRWDGNVIPGRIEELLREVTIRPGGEVTGCVLGHNIRIEGPAEVHQAVYATKALELIASGDIRLRSGVGARELISVDEDRGRVIVEGDVVGKNLRLSNAVVRGSVHGDEIRLSNCLVLGLVHGRRLAELADTTVLSADAAKLKFGRGCALILPFARATESLEISDRVALAVGADDGDTLGPEDLVRRDGTTHLTGGRRLTAFDKLQGQLENLTAFMYQLTVGDAVREGGRQVTYDAGSLPKSVTKLLPEIV